ncbi:kyphoscoliosis peptidase [Biomphalaria pfeifferi]|uniref:Kyphoscoliosis peptidase n=1 Tax=Biomphalaria pfeifferi TaxID=112525 RepID=A0AAD8BDW9_BIOPF|nr:kyphoscoliosis peptidase [Biomphalaria pfeifferi]
MDERPTLQNGYLGAQPLFSEFGLLAKSHAEPEFETNENEFVIKLKASQPVKITSKIVSDETLGDSQERVFIQTRGEDVNLLVSLDMPGYHRLQIYALPAADDSKQLPGVFNYLIHCTGTPRKSRLFPKQFAQWKDGCVLLEPFSLAGDHIKGDVVFRLMVPNALAVAVTIEENWFHLDPGDNGIWTGRVNDIERFKGRGLYAVLNANFSEEDETKYSSLLQYTL